MSCTPQVSNRRVAFSVKDLLEIIPISERRLRELINTGELPSKKIGNKVMVPRSVVEEFVETHLGESLPC